MVARARWRAAEDRLYPSLLADPAGYQRGIAAVQAVLAELRRRANDVSDLVGIESAPDDVVGTACPDGVALPVDLLVAVACGMRDRELTAEQDHRRRQAAIDAARAAGAAWALLDGPEDPADLVDGRRLAVHLASGTVVEMTVDPWARGEAFGLTVTPGDTASFSDRAAWLAELARVEGGIAAG